MKKIIASSSALIALAFASVGTAFAASQVSEQLCPSSFASLCTINLAGNGFVGVVLQVLLIIAIIVCLFFLIFGGIRYMTSGGDKGRLDQARSTLIAAVVGLIISLAAFFIVNFLLFFFTGQGISNMTIPNLLQ